METKEIIPLALSFIGLLITLIIQWDNIVNANWKSLSKLFGGFTAVALGLLGFFEVLSPSFRSLILAESSEYDPRIAVGMQTLISTGFAVWGTHLIRRAINEVRK